MKKLISRFLKYDAQNDVLSALDDKPQEQKSGLVNRIKEFFNSFNKMIKSLFAVVRQKLNNKEETA